MTAPKPYAPTDYRAFWERQLSGVVLPNGEVVHGLGKTIELLPFEERLIREPRA